MREHAAAGGQTDVLADAEAGKPAAQLRGRLKDNLECASQLYTYRAAMEGTAAAALLDEQIAAEMAGTGLSRGIWRPSSPR